MKSEIKFKVDKISTIVVLSLFSILILFLLYLLPVGRDLIMNEFKQNYILIYSIFFTLLIIMETISVYGLIKEFNKTYDGYLKSIIEFHKKELEMQDNRIDQHKKIIQKAELLKMTIGSKKIYNKKEKPDGQVS